MPKVPEHILEWRRRTGADQWDEMWEGVLHAAPSPNRDHQDFEGALEFWLRLHWAVPNGHRVYHQINVSEPGSWPNNYRIPDLVLLTSERFEIDFNEYFDGGPDVIVEIRSPDDEAYEKLKFYGSVGVREAWIIDRESKGPEILEFVGREFQSCSPNQDGWLTSPATKIQMRAAQNDKLEISMPGRSDTRALLP